jgi:PadR family transcriptional regulator, regulatory protein PadR
MELRRGSLILAVLGALREERYGYTLRSALADQGVEIDEGALYPMLRRLETQGLLTSQWREDAKRQKRFYRLSEDGAAALKHLTDEWRAMNGAIETILKETAR